MTKHNSTIPYIASKGGGGGAKEPTLTPDNLRSKDTIEVVLGLCEGPIYGLRNGAKDFYVGDTPLQNANGSYNFTAFKLDVATGVESPDPVTYVLGGSSNNTAVNIALATGAGVTRQTSGGFVDFIEFRIAVNRLVKTNTEGTFNNSVTFRIEYKPASSGSWTKVYNNDIKITGKTSSIYVKEFRVAVPRISEAYDLRVTKISAANTETLFSDISWESFQEVIANQPTYPNTATVHLVGQATDQFTSTPQWSGIYKGLLVKVPSNYNPDTRQYSGIWDGDWQVAWTNNPAWCLYDFVMNDRYGMKSYYRDVQLDKYDVYDAAVWCDEMVPDGEGGVQPRYTFNAYIAEARSGKEMARYLAGAFNSTFFDDLNGTAFLKVDKDDPAVHIFTKENVYEEGFEYTYTDIDSRYNDITVTYLNPNLDWIEDRRRVFDQDLIDLNGRIPLDFIAVGCTNTHEAKRRAQYKLITANTETCQVSFKTNRRGQFVQPFDVILICDPDMGYGVSGRIKTISEDRNSINLRDPVYLEAGVEYTINIEASDGTKYTSTFTTSTLGYNLVLNLDDTLPEDIIPDKAVFTLEHPTYIGLPRPFRVLKVEEIDGNPDIYNIEAININRNKWYDADNLTNTDVIDYSALPNPSNPPGPTTVLFEETFVREFKEYHLIVTPTFNRGSYKYYANDHSFDVWSRPSGSGEPFVKREVVRGDTLINHPPGNYDFKILGKSYLGFTSDLDSVSTHTFNVTNPLTPPSDIDWVRINRREVYWGYTTAPEDFAGFVLRYHNQAGRTTWDDAARPHQGVITSTSFYTSLIPASARVIMVRAVDVFGVTSANSAIVYRDAGDLTFFNIVEQFDYHPTFAGSKTNCRVISGNLKANDAGEVSLLDDAGEQLLDDDGDSLLQDSTGSAMYSGTPAALVYDGGNFYESNYKEMVYEDTFTTAYSGDLVVSLALTSSGYEVRYKEQSASTWLPVPDRSAITPGDYDIQLRVFGGSIRGDVSAFSVIIDVPDVTEDVQDLSVSSIGTRVPLAKTYSVIKIVNVIIQDDGVNAPVGYRVTDKDVTSGPLITLYDATGSAVDGVVDVQIKGYYRETTA